MRFPMKTTGLALLIAVAGCSDGAEREPDRYYTGQSMHDFMNKVMQPAAEGVWDKTGYLTDEDGFHTLFPQDDDEWQEAEAAALLVAELSNVLAIPGRRTAERDWDEAVKGVRLTSLAAADAARKRNEDDFMKFALALNNACQSCHVKYARPDQQ